MGPGGVVEMYSITYKWRTDLRDRGVRPEPKAIGIFRSFLRDQLFKLWSARLECPVAGHRVVEAIRPVLREWADGQHNAVTY